MIATCLLLLHAPDGSALLVRDAAFLVREVTGHQDHVTKGTHSVIYTTTNAKGIGVQERFSAVLDIVRMCH